MDLEKQAEESRRAIKTAQRQMDIQKTSSRAEVFRLRGYYLFLLTLMAFLITVLNR